MRVIDGFIIFYGEALGDNFIIGTLLMMELLFSAREIS